MSKIIDYKGVPRLGVFSDKITDVNYEDYDLETPMGFPVPRFIRKYKANQFCFIGLINRDFMAGLAVIDLKIASSAFFYVYLREKNSLIEIKKTGLPLRSCVSISNNPSDPAFYFRSASLNIDFSDFRIKAEGEDLKLDAKIDPSVSSPLRICTKAGYRGWVYTEKSTPLEISGVLEAGGGAYAVNSPETLALMDWTCGYMRRQTCWNWASTAFALKSGEKIGLNLSWGVNETGWTENAFWIDGKMTRCSNSIFEFDKNDLMKPWKIYTEDGKIDLEFLPSASRSEKINAVVAASRFTQLSGTFEGCLKNCNGLRIELKDVPGWTEDHYAKW